MMPNNKKANSNLKDLDKDAIEIGIGGYSSEKSTFEYQKRMQKRKEIQLKRVQERDKTKGLIIVFTGNGKGKTTSALGLALRTLGHGDKVSIIQFIKGGWESGEAKALRKFGKDLNFEPLGGGFTWETQDRELDRKLVLTAWEKSLTYLKDPEKKLVILDEINIAMKLGYISLKSVFDGIYMRPAMTHVALTGRGAPIELINKADLVTEMKLIHHPFKEQNIKAQAGIEF